MANKTGERVRELREKLQLSQDQLGQMLGYTGKAAISKIETGVNGIPSDKINDFACSMPHYPKRNRFGVFNAQCVLEPLEAFFLFYG